jgi:hypothetical protein
LIQRIKKMTRQSVNEAQQALHALTGESAIPGILHRLSCRYATPIYDATIAQLEALTVAFSGLSEASKQYAADQQKLRSAIVDGADLPDRDMRHIVLPEWIWVSPIDGGGGEMLILADDFEANLHVYVRGHEG